MWGWFKKRQEDDLRRLVSAYRFFLKAGRQAEGEVPGNLGLQERRWKGGFGQAYQLLFKDWPSPNQSRRFEHYMIRRLRKTADLDRAFIQAFNDFLDQKRLTDEELAEIFREGASLSP